MRKLLLAASLLLSCYSFAQTTIWTEDFENSCTSGCYANGSNTGNGAWTQTENSPSVDGCGYTNTPNAFYISCAENGNGAGMCGTICANDESLHIGSVTVGDQGASYDAGGWCDFGLGGLGDGTTTDTRIESPAIDLTGETSPSVNFNYMENGQGAIDDASLWYYDGSSWALLDALAKTAMCGLQGTWTAFSIALPASANNNPNVKIAFLWVNNDDATGSDPSFAVDDITITVPLGASNSITTGTVNPMSWCQGMTTTLQVNFTSTGTFNPGNVYTVELSDAVGSFAAPTSIGTLASTANSGIITAIVSGATPAGTGYRVRVVSSDPITVGSDNGTDLAINPAPSVDAIASQTVCDGELITAVNFSSATPGASFAWTNSEPSIGLVGSGSGNIAAFTGTNVGAVPLVGTIVVTPTANGCAGASGQFTIIVNPTPAVTFTPVTTVCEGSSPLTLAGGSPSGGVYSGTGVAGGIFDPLVAGVGSTVITYDYVDGNGCSNSAAQAIEVIALPTVTLQPFVDVCEGSASVNLVGGSPLGGAYSGTAVSAGSFDPGTAGQGTTDITYTYSDGNGCSNTAVAPITVIPSPAVTLTPFADVCDIDPFFTLTGGSPAGGTYTGPGVTGGVFDPMTAGPGTHTLTYSFTDGNGCTGEAFETIFVAICGSIGENGLNNFVLYPNPVSESFTLVSDLSIEKVQVLDMSGRIVKSFNEQQLSYDVSEVPAGVYFVTIHTSEQISQLRIIVE